MADAAGIPAYLPNRIQFRGMAYTFVRTEEATAVGELTRIDCVGAFELASAANTDVTQVLFLRIPESTADSQLVFRFEAALTFTVDIEITGQSRDISIGDQPGDRYHLSESWQPALLSSTTVMLFVKDPENATPDVYLAVNVHDTVVGEVIGEYRLPGENSQTSETMSTAATNVGLNPDLTINGQLYVLVNIYYPVGTTPNGFITFFSNQPGGQPDILLARDTRERELFIYRTTATGG